MCPAPVPPPRRRPAPLVTAVYRLADVLGLIAALCIGAAIVIINYMIVVRALGNAAFWEIEASVYLLICGTFFGSPYTLRTNGHVGIDLLPLMLSGRLGRVIRSTAAAMGLLVCLFLGGQGFEMAFESWSIGETGDSMWAPPLWPVKASMAIGMIVTALVYVVQMVETARESSRDEVREEAAAAPEAIDGRRSPS